MIKEELLKWFEDSKKDHYTKLAIDTIYNLFNIFNDKLTDNYVVFNNGGGVYFQIWINIDEDLFNYYIDKHYVFYIKYKGVEYKCNQKLKV